MSKYPSIDSNGNFIETNNHVSEIEVPFSGAADVQTLQHAYYHMWSAGLVHDITVTQGVGNSVNVTESNVVLRSIDDDEGAITSFVIAAQNNIAVPSNTASFLYADYNGGSPILAVTSNFGDLDFRTKIPYAGLYCDGTTVYILKVYNFNTDGLNKIQQRFLDDGTEHITGTIVSETGTRNISITAGKFYIGVRPITTTALDTSAADTFSYWYQDGVGGWTEVTTQTQVDNTQYDDGSGTLASIATHSYSQTWIYLVLTDSGPLLHCVYGSSNESQLDTILDVTPPSSLPPLLTVIGVLVGRAVVRQGTTTLYQIDSAFVNGFGTSAITNHNDLAGLQGGVAGEYNHLTNAEYAALSTKPTMYIQAEEPTSAVNGDFWVQTN